MGVAVTAREAGVVAGTAGSGVRKGVREGRGVMGMVVMVGGTLAVAMAALYSTVAALLVRITLSSVVGVGKKPARRSSPEERFFTNMKASTAITVAIKSTTRTISLLRRSFFQKRISLDIFLCSYS